MPAETEEKKSDEAEGNGEVAPASGESGAAAPSSATPVDPVAEAKAEAARMKDQWMRTAADFDNFRKRSRRELEDNRKAGKEELLKEFLPVFDNLERAIQSAQRATDVKGLALSLIHI